MITEIISVVKSLSTRTALRLRNQITTEFRRLRIPGLKIKIEMGNTHCIADGGCPQRCDITIANNTEFNLYLDPSKSCGRECHHQGKTKTFFSTIKIQTFSLDRMANH